MGSILMKSRNQKPLENPWRSSTLVPGSPLLEQQSSLIAVLHSSFRNTEGLAALIRSLAKEYPGNYAFKLRRLSRLIEEGTPWIDALEQTPGALPNDAVLALRVGHQSGISEQTLDQLRIDNSEALLSREKNHWKGYLTYWLSVSLVMLLVQSFFSVFIGPTIRKVLAEFDLDRNQSNLALIERYSTIPYLIAIGLIILGIVLNWSDSFRFWLWRVLGIQTDSETKKRASLFNILANTTKNGRPMAGTLSTLAKYHSDSDMRKRLLIARNEIEQGTQPWDSLESVGLISAPQKEILTGQTNENQAWILRSLANALAAHEQFRWGWTKSIIQPLILVGFGFAVLGLSYSVLDGLYSMVSELAKDSRWR